jgi:PAT family beta-lactamase induction signal transducer AmpG
MASLGVFGRTLLASSSGYIVDSLDGNWALFFILTALMVIPSLVFLRMIKEPIMRMEERM